jgi:hypothetical protein
LTLAGLSLDGLVPDGLVMAVSVASMIVRVSKLVAIGSGRKRHAAKHFTELRRCPAR